MYYTIKNINKAIKTKYIGTWWLYADSLGNCMHATEYRDLATEMAQEMAYDANGNLQYDLDRRISAIHYNLLNLPELICFMDGRKIVNLYDAAGRKHGTWYYAQDDSLPAYSTWYDGHYERTDYADTLVPSLCRVHHAEGYVSSGREAATPPVIHYYHRDHLGNTCAVWNATADSVVQRTLYYASGMPMAGSTGQPYQPYKYNGKEFVNEYGYDEYDSQARWYYPAVMRTTTIDPLSETYYATSPYVWCANNPVNMIDSDGMTWRYADGNEITDHSKVMVYIFYDPNSFEKQSNQIYMDAVKKYGEGSAALSNVTTEKEFAQDWGNMASPNIKEVNLNYHGNNQTLMLDHANGQYITATGNGKSNVSSTPSKNVQDLSAPLGDISNAQLNINSCKSNSKTQYPLKGSGQTLMEAFAYTFNFKTIRGTSAGVSYNRFTMQPEPQFFWQSWDYIGKIPVLPTSSSNVSNSVYYRTGGMK